MSKTKVCICDPKRLPCGCPKIPGPCACGCYDYVEGDVDAYCEVHGTQAEVSVTPFEKTNEALVEAVEICLRNPVIPNIYDADARAALTELVARLERAERRLAGPHVYTEAAPGDVIGHDGWECDEGCDACFFGEKWQAAEARVQALEEALRFYAERRWYAPVFGDRVPTDGVGMIGVRDSFDGGGPGARARAALAGSEGE